MEKKDANLNQKLKELEQKEEEIAQIKKEQTIQLEKISGMTREEAVDILMKDIEEDVRHDAAKLVKEIEQEAKEKHSKARHSSSKQILTSLMQQKPFSISL